MPGKFFLYPYQKGDVILSKKAHPCSSKRWLVEEVAAERITISCTICKHCVSLERGKIEAMTKSVEKA